MSPLSFPYARLGHPIVPSMVGSAPGGASAELSPSAAPVTPGMFPSQTQPLFPGQDFLPRGKYVLK